MPVVFVLGKAERGLSDPPPWSGCAPRRKSARGLGSASSILRERPHRILGEQLIERHDQALGVLLREHHRRLDLEDVVVPSVRAQKDPDMLRPLDHVACDF